MNRSIRFDVAGLGEVMLRLSVPAGERLDDARRLEVEYGGAECNTCMALARLGRRVAWVGRLPDHALGNAVLRAVRADGVDVSGVRQAPGERIGTYFIEYAGAPRAIQVIYDRANSAAARMTAADVDWDVVLGAKVLHVSGITAGLSDSCHAMVMEAIRRARQAGVTVSFDVNYRARLWSAAAAGEKLRPLIAEADLLFCKGADAAALFGCGGEPQEQLGKLQALTGAQAIFGTYGAQGAALLQRREFVHQPAIPAQVVDRIGSGDAFAAGALDGFLDGDLRAGLARGVAVASIALTQHGDRVLTSRAELEAVLARSQTDVAR
jgi:2-dehydro-3-deoxygluconokinase